MAEQGGLNQDQKGARQEHQGGRREGGAGEEVRFRNLRNQEGTAAVVGGEEVRLRNVKMRQKRARPSAGRPKSEVIGGKISSKSWGTKFKEKSDITMMMMIRCARSQYERQFVDL